MDPLHVATSSFAWSADEPPFGCRQRLGLAAERIVLSVSRRSHVCTAAPLLQEFSCTRVPDLRALLAISMHLPSERSDLSAGRVEPVLACAAIACIHPQVGPVHGGAALDVDATAADPGDWAPSAGRRRGLVLPRCSLMILATDGTPALSVTKSM